MALNATILKFDVSIADIDRHYYADHALTVAHHPSETDERVMVRLLAFAMHAHERLVFGRGLSSDDEPDFVQTDLTGAIELWGMVGLPDERIVRKAAGRARRVALLAYGGARCESWWQRQGPALARLANLQAWSITPDESRALASLIGRNVKLAISAQDHDYLLASNERAVRVSPARLTPASKATAS